MKTPEKPVTRIILVLICAVLSCSLLTANLFALAEDTVSVSVPAANMPPVADSLEFTTFRNIPVIEKLTAVDPDGDVLTFEIITQPKKGTVTVSEDGTFVYTPKDNYKGKDSFVYVAVDSVGNLSAEASVKIVVKKQTCKTTYADLDGSDAAYAALVLSENGIFTGEALGGEYFFRPDQPVTRGEFLAMCLKTCDANMLTGVTRTGFSDDDNIPLWVKPYVSTALMSGVIKGYKDSDGSLVFAPESPITFSEAAVILNNALGLQDVVSAAAVEPDDSLPVWAYTACVNLSAHSVIPDGVANVYDEYVTRGDAAKMLLTASGISDSGGGGLLAWAK